MPINTRDINSPGAWKLGSLELQHRLIELMPPTGEDRFGQSPGLLAPWYAAIAHAGRLIITEPCFVSMSGRASLGDGGFYTAQQVNGWRSVADAVHSLGGKIVAQLHHIKPVSPDGKRKLCLDDIDEMLSAYRSAAENVADAGFDGIEVRATPDATPGMVLRDLIQLKPHPDSPDLAENFGVLVEIVRTVSAVCDPLSVGVRLSPEDVHGATDIAHRCKRLLAELSQQPLGWVHFELDNDDGAADLLAMFSPRQQVSWLASGKVSDYLTAKWCAENTIDGVAATCRSIE